MDIVEQYNRSQLIESISEVLQHQSGMCNEDVKQFVNAFVSKLASYMPGGIQGLPQRILNVIANWRTRNMDKVSVASLGNEPTPQEIDQAARYLGVQDKAGLAWNLKLFYGELKKNLPNGVIDPQVFYRQFSNWINTHNIDLLKATPQQEPLNDLGRELIQADPSLAPAIKKTLSDLSDTHFRQLAVLDRRTTTGKDSFRKILGDFGGEDDFKSSDDHMGRLKKLKRQFQRIRQANNPSPEPEGL